MLGLPAGFLYRYISSIYKQHLSTIYLPPTWDPVQVLLGILRLYQFHLLTYSVILSSILFLSQFLVLLSKFFFGKFSIKNNWKFLIVFRLLLSLSIFLRIVNLESIRGIIFESSLSSLPVWPDWAIFQKVLVINFLQQK